MSDHPTYDGTTTRDVKQLCPGDHVVVVGAGPAGLTAAYLLAKRGYGVTVLEADSLVGGISRTAEYRGFRFDIGGHRFLTKIPEVQQLWEELLGDEFITVPRLSRIHYSGKYFDYPLKTINALRGLGLIEVTRIVFSYLMVHLQPRATAENFEQWVINRFGKRLYQIFFKTYTEKVWGIPCTEIRAEWAAQRIPGLSLARAILNATALPQRGPAIKSLTHEFHYPRLGPGQMWEACAGRIEALDGKVLLQHRADAIVCENGEAVGVEVTTSEGTQTIRADHVISTTDIRSLVGALTPTPPMAVTAAAGKLRYRDFLVVALILEADNLFPDNWIYIHTPGVRVGRIQNFNNWSKAMVPTPGHTCLGMEYFCFEGDGLWTASDDELVRLATRELTQLDLAPDQLVRDGTVIRMPKAYPIYDAMYREHLGTVRSYIDPIANLHTVGRNGMHKYNNQDHSMLTAMLAVSNMQGGAHDVWAANTDFEYQESVRVIQRAPPGGVAT
jgi:protoporphyrinogen oxidase